MLSTAETFCQELQYVRLRQVFLARWVFPVKGLPPQQVMSGSDGGGVSNGAKLKTIQESSKLKTSDGIGGGSTGSVKNIYESFKKIISFSIEGKSIKHEVEVLKRL